MHALALILATSLALGPAVTTTEAPTPTDEADAQGSVDAPAADNAVPDAAQPDEPEADPAEADPAEADAAEAEAAAPSPGAETDPAEASEPSPGAETEPAEAKAEASEPSPSASSPKPEATDPPSPSAPDTAPPPHDHEPAAPAPRDRLGCGGSKTCKRMTIAGIVLGSLGLIGVGTGAGLLARPDQIDEELPIYVISSQPAGLVTVTVSAGVTLTSILILVAAHRGYKQRGVAALEPIPGGFRF